MAKPRRPARKVRYDEQRVAYSDAFVRWLTGLGYRVGIGGVAIEPSAFLELARGLAKEVGVYYFGPLAPSVAGLLQGGASAEEAASRLEPIGGLVDVVGTQSGVGWVRLRALLHGDDLAPDRIVDRLEVLHDFAPQLRSLARMRIPVLMEPMTTIEVLVAFVDTARFDAVVDDVVAGAWQGSGANVVRATCVDLQSHRLAEPAAKGGAVVGELLGTSDWIDEDDLCHLDMLAEQRKATP